MSTTLLRVPLDTIPDQRVFVYKYLSDDFLHLVRKGLPIEACRKVLRATLQAISQLHGGDVVHLGTELSPSHSDLDLTFI